LTTMTREITKMVALLPEAEQNLAYEFVKRMVLAWDPDFTKLTLGERKGLDSAIAEGGYVGMETIDWD